MSARVDVPVPAVGGTRTVPAPDPIAQDYLLLGLRLDQRIRGLVDGLTADARRGQISRLKTVRSSPSAS